MAVAIYDGLKANHPGIAKTWSDLWYIRYKLDAVTYCSNYGYCTPKYISFTVFWNKIDIRLCGQ